MLYAQFAFYWGVVAVGMLLNYYYAVPSTLQPTISSIFIQIGTAPLLVVHVALAIASTAISVPIIILARRMGLMPVAYLHMGAMATRAVSFVSGPLFLYYSTGSMANVFDAGLSTFAMASALIVAVILTFMSRIFIVREDVRIKYGLFP
jgi:hypothetical protein